MGTDGTIVKTSPIRPVSDLPDIASRSLSDAAKPGITLLVVPLG
jgi:hypothetical protein